MQRHTSREHDRRDEQHDRRSFRSNRNQLSYGDDTSAYDDEYWSNGHRRTESQHRRTSARSVDGDRYYQEQRNRQPSRSSRNQLSYGDDSSAYSDDYWSQGRERSRSGRHRNSSARSVEDDINYWSDQNFGRGQSNARRNIRQETPGYDNVRHTEHYSNHPRHVRGRYQVRDAHPDDLDYVRYPDGGPGRGGESRRSHWAEDASYYEYRESRQNANARRAARNDMHHQDLNYFDRDYHTLDAGRYNDRRNISYNDHRHEERRNPNRRAHNEDRWHDYDQRRRSHDSRDARGRYRRW